MYFRKHWDVLIVDDEPDVLQMTKIALKKTRVYNIPVKIHEFLSMKDAVHYFETAASVPDLSLAVIDVVMETDTAGLDLCDHIRNKLKNRVTGLCVRTGQPGKAPEKSVIDKYDIDYYISKVDATQDKLYVVAQTAIRNFLNSRSSSGFFRWLNVLTQANTRDELPVKLRQCVTTFSSSVSGAPLDAINAPMAFRLGGQWIGFEDYAGAGVAQGVAEKIASTPVDQLAEHQKGPNGETYARVGDEVLMTVPEGGEDCQYVAKVNFTPAPEFLILTWWNFLGAVRNLHTHLK